MRAWQSGATATMEALSFVADAAMPALNAGEMLVRVTHAALNFSDLLMIEDRYQVRPPRPFIPGQEVAGIVVEAPGSSGFRKGDRIASKVLWGGFSEFVAVRADMAIRVPDGYSLAQAAALPVSYTTALVALTRCAPIEPSHFVVVHAAAGGAGLAAVEVAAARGATVIATAGSEEKLAVARSHGARFGINYRDPDWYRQVDQVTGGHGADIIFDPVGGEIGSDSLRCIARDGTLLIVGFSSGTMPKLAPNRLLLKRASAKGVYWNHDTDAEMIERLNQDLAALIASERIDPVVDDRYGLESLTQALSALAQRQVRGKMVLQVGGIEGVS